ncbi:MAG: autotransporter domain-containing protein [Pseudomonadota bacterium]
MNKAYRLIKNRYSGLVQVAPETAKAHGKGKGIVKAGTLAAVLACTSPMAWAADTYWNNAGTGNWFTTGNWDTSAVPTNADTAYIDNGGTAQVQAAGAVASNLRIGYSGTGNLEISNGGTLISAWPSYVGQIAGGIGRVTVDGIGSTWTSNWGAEVGYGGTGVLNITGGGTVNSSMASTVGSRAGTGAGTVTVDGIGSTWTSTSFLEVGRDGTGVLNITGGGTVNGQTVYLGMWAGSSGTINIGTDGGAGILNTAEVKGGSGTATLNFNHTDSDYYFTRTGAAGGTAVKITGSTAVNHNGSGTTTLNGANTYTGTTKVNAGTLILAGGAAIADTGAVVVNGGGTLNLAASETIGSLAGAGSVSLNANTLTTGGNNASTTYSGAMSGSGGLTKTGTGTFTLTGASTLTGDTTVNGGGLTIASGGTLSNKDSYLGSSTSGTVTVDGPGSTWTNTGYLYLGYLNTGALSISNGGVVNSDESWLAVAAGTSGTATVDGTDSTWTNSNDLLVGDNGSGTLTITNGGAVSNTNGTIGRGFNASSTVTVNGAGSTWTNSGNLIVGVLGPGTLTVSDGAAVNVAAGTGTVTLAESHLSSSGTLNIGDGGAAGILNAASVTGGSGTATLNFNHTSNPYYFTNDGTSGGTAINITGSTAVNHNGSGTTFLTGTNTYTGGTTVNAGTLSLAGGSAIADTGAVVVNGGGTLDLAASETIGSLAGAGNVTLNTNTLTTGGNNASTTYSGAMTGSGMLTKTGTGTFTLTGNSEFTAPTFVKGGTLDISSGGTLRNLFGRIGDAADEVGTVVVDGIGSVWTNTDALVVGHNGTGTLNIADGGTVNAGSAPLSLAAAASASGTLNIGTGVGAGVLNATAVNGGLGAATLNFNHTDGAYYFTNDGTSGGTAINITGSTAVNQIGSGTTYLTGTNTYSGATTISGGTLAVNGSLTNSAVTVNSGGTLGGSGSIGGAVTVNSGGTLAPGNSPGLLTVGSLTLGAGSTTTMEIDGTTRGTQYDAIDVTGTATLGGTLNLVFGYTPTVGDSYTLIDAAAINGDFSTIATSGLGAALKMVPTITSDYVMTVNFAQESFVTAAGGRSALTGNQSSVAANLDTFSTSGRAADLIAALNTLPAGALPSAYDSLSGVQHSHSLPQAMRASRQFTQVIGERLGWGGSNPSTAEASRLGIVQLAYNGDDVGGLLEVPKPSEVFWLRAMGGFGDIDGDGNAMSADYNSSGVALGYDREVRDGLLAGVAFSYTRSNVDMSEGGTDIDSYQLAAYGREQWDNDYLAATFGIGRHFAAGTRQVQFTGFSGVAQADYRIDDIGLSLEAGRHYALSDNHRVTPFAGLEYGHYRQNGFTETGAGAANLTYGDDSMDSLRSVLGARMDSVLTGSGGMQFDTTVGLAWAHELMDREALLNPAFAANGSVPFNVQGPVLDRDHALATLGVSARLGKQSRLDLDYRGEFADSDRQHAVSATFRMTW